MKQELKRSAKNLEGGARKDNWTQQRSWGCGRRYNRSVWRWK